MNSRPEAIQNYARKFHQEHPTSEPTDDAIYRALKHCALAPLPAWYGEIRDAVTELRSNTMGDEDMTNKTDERTIYALARLADCHDPDTAESPGAQFLRSVETYTEERVHWEKDNDEETDVSDLAHEIADATIPVYTGELWATFVDLQAWDEDISDYGDFEGDIEQVARWAVYGIGRRLAEALIEELREVDGANDEDEEE
jgi:hypothetical protein